MPKKKTDTLVQIPALREGHCDGCIFNQQHHSLRDPCAVEMINKINCKVTIWVLKGTK